MANNLLTQYSEYRLQDTISRLEGFRCSIGWGQLNDDLQVAIDCLEYMREAIKEADKVPEIPDLTEKAPHWVIDDHGFAGKYYRCSKCGKGHWQDVHESHKNYCYHCFTNMEGPDEHRR